MGEKRKFDSVLLGNGITINIFHQIKHAGYDIIDFFDYLENFLSYEYHKKEKREFFKIYRGLVYDDEIKNVENFIKSTFDEAKEIGFERMMSSKIFIKPEKLQKHNMTLDEYDRNIKNVSSYYFLLYNYWYLKKILPNLQNYNLIVLNISDKIKSIVNESKIYSLNFDKILDKYLDVKHVHGSFSNVLEEYSDIVSFRPTPTTFNYKFVFGTSGIEKLSGLNDMYKNNIKGFDYEFMYSKKNFGDLLIYGVAFGLSKVIPRELKEKYDDFYLANCVEGHILARINALFINHQINSITLACFNKEDKKNYQELFENLECNKIVKYIDSKELF